jgi:protein-export membrane protein SecD
MGVDIRTRNWVITVIILVIAVIVPFWKLNKGEAAVKQGIDLVGGVDMLLLAQPPAGETTVTQDMMAGAISVLRKRLDPEGVKEIVLQQMGEDRIVVQIPGEDDPERVKKLIGETATLRFINAADKPLADGTKLRYINAATGEPVNLSTAPVETPSIPLVFTASEVLYKGAQDFAGFRPYTEEPGAPSRNTESALSTASGDISLEFNQSSAIGLTAKTATLQGHNFALIVDDTLKAYVPITAALTQGRIVFKGLGNDPTFNYGEVNTNLERVKIVDTGTTPPTVGQHVIIYDPMAGEAVPNIPEPPQIVDVKTDQVILTGDDFKSANVTYGRMGEPIIAFEFKPAAAQIFGRYTTQHVRQYLAIALDDIVISCPVIREPIIGGRGVIEGKFTIDEATDLVVKLNSGRLPVTFNVIENRTVGPSLGIKSISDSKKAAVAGAILVLLFMFLYYRLPGLMADIALLYYVVIFFGALSLLNATLTLPGIAGFVMSVGMAVDANVIIFERLKEELRSGKTFRSALDAAFRRAWTAIFDSNITTIMAGVVLYNLGTGAIRGFAVTLVLGVAVSMFSAIIVTRLLLEWVVGGKGMQEYWLYGVSIPKGSAISKGGEV